jgi:hypothetical protein
MLDDNDDDDDREEAAGGGDENGGGQHGTTPGHVVDGIQCDNVRGRDYDVRRNTRESTLGRPVRG